MKVFTYSEARQQLARVLDEAKAQGEIRIKPLKMHARQGGRL